MTLPAAALPLIARILDEMAKGNRVEVVPTEADMTTQEAADALGVSRPYLIQMLEAGKLPFHKVGTHRRIAIADVMRYRDERRAARMKVLSELTAEAQELNMGY